MVQIKRIISSCLVIPVLLFTSGCAVGAATSAYSLNSKSADDLTASARKSIVDEAVQKSKEYVDQNCAKK